MGRDLEISYSGVEITPFFYMSLTFDGGLMDGRTMMLRGGIHYEHERVITLDSFVFQFGHGVYLIARPQCIYS